LKYRIHTAAERCVKPGDPMFIRQSGFVDSDKVGGHDGFQIPKPVSEQEMVAADVNGNHLSVQNGNALDLRKRQFSHFLIPVSHNVVRTGEAADQVFDLLGQRGRSMDDGDNLLFRVFIDNEFVFHRI
jgi:hypothetical protein